MIRSSCLTFLSLTLLSLLLVAQVPTPRPAPVPSPRPSPTPTVRRDPPAQPPRPPQTKRQIEERRGDPQRGNQPPAPTPTPGARPVPGAPGAPELPAAEVAAAAKRLDIWRRSLRPAHREHWKGRVVFLDERRKGKTVNLEMVLARDADGALRLRFRHERLGDLPEARALRLSDAKGKVEWWRFRPEEGRTSHPDDGRSGPVAGLLADLVPFEPAAGLELRYEGAGLLDARRVLLYRCGTALISFRPDLNLVARVEFLDAEGKKALRELRFDDDERRGLHRRFTRVTRHDYESGDSLRIEWETPTINDEIAADYFSPEALAGSATDKGKED